MCEHCKAENTAENEEEGKLSVLKIVISIILLFGAIFCAIPILKIFLFFLSYITVAFDIIKNAYLNLKKGEIFDESLLMLIASFGAFCIGKYSEAVMVMLLYTIGEFAQDSAVEKSKKSISSLMDLKVETVEVLHDEKIDILNPKDVKKGSVILLKTGDKVPLDGVIIQGRALIDASILTGEAMPLNVEENSEILSGSIILQGAIKIKTTKKYEDTTISKIMELVEKSAKSKAKTEKFITKFARIYTPFVIFLAFALFIIPVLFFNQSFEIWLFRALTFLVISCPCALVISVPLTFFSGLGAASRHGILIKGGTYIESISKIKNVVFDKTGTLTKGNFEVQKVIKLSDISENEILKIAASIEKFSNHPIAISISRAYKGDLYNDIKDIKETMGLGIEAVLDGKKVIAGTYKMFKDFSLDVKENMTSVFVSINDKVIGYILLADTIKQESKETISFLKKANINCIMLTGDNKNAALNVSKELGIDEIHYQLLPYNKVEIVEKLIKNEKKGETTAFMGDGINDAPVLKRADIGFAMGVSGSDSAIEAADAVLMNDNPYKIADAVKISKKTISIVKQNIFFALFIKVLFLILGAFGLMTMWGAVFCDVGVTILAIVNSLRVLRIN